MVEEYKLPYSGADIYRRLRDVDVKASIKTITSDEYDSLTDNELNTNILYMITDDESDESKVVQPDWNQNDETAVDYIKNRPFYSKPKEILPKTDASSNVSTIYFNEYLQVEEGKTYKVIWDGQEYTYLAEYDDDFGITFGNESIWDSSLENTQEPFFIAVNGIYLNNVEQHTLEILCIADTDGTPLEDIIVEEFTLDNYQLYPTFVDYIDFANMQECVVVFDDVEYICHITGYADDYNSQQYIGNISLMSGDESDNTGEPFFISSYSYVNAEENGYYYETYIQPTTLGSHTIQIVDKNGEIKKLDPKYLPEGGVGYTTAGVENAILLEEQTIDLSGGVIGVEIPNSPIFIEGETYHVTFDGIEYDCVAWSVDGEIVYIGNGDIYGGEGQGNGEPFSYESFVYGCYLYTFKEDSCTIKIEGKIAETCHKIDEKFIPDTIARVSDIPEIDGFVTQEDMYNALENTSGITAGTGACAEAFNYNAPYCANGDYSHSEGKHTYAVGECSHAEGEETLAYGAYSHAEGRISDGRSTRCSGVAGATEYSHSNYGDSFVVGRIVKYGTTFAKIINATDTTFTVNNTLSPDKDIDDEFVKVFKHGAIGECSHAEGLTTAAFGNISHAEGYKTIAVGACSHAEGDETIAASYCQHVQGKYNIKDSDDRFAHIVGNGSDDENRSNAHTVDWNGNAWFQGDVYVGGTSQDDGERLARLSDITSLPDINYPVTSVNGQTGDVNLTASDVGALSDDTVIPEVPTNISAFTNDAGYLTEHQSLEGLATESYVDTKIENIQAITIEEIDEICGFSVVNASEVLF